MKKPKAISVFKVINENAYFMNNLNYGKNQKGIIIYLHSLIGITKLKTTVRLLI